MAAKQQRQQLQQTRRQQQQQQQQEKEDQSVAGKIQHVQDLCLYPNHAESATTLIYHRLLALQQVLASIREPIRDGRPLQILYDALSGIELTIVTVLSMNRIVYLVQAERIQETFEASLHAVSLSLDALLKKTQSTQELSRHKKEYNAVCSNQTAPFASLRLSIEQEQSRLAMCGTDQEFAATLKELIGVVSREEIAEALKVLEKDIEQVAIQLQKPWNDAQARGNVIHLQGLMGLVLDHLKAHPKYVKAAAPTSSTTTDYPDWALDPITRQVMENPVILRAPCEHVIDKSTFVHYIVEQGHTNCPVCQVKLKSMFARPHKQLAKKIRTLVQVEESKKHEQARSNKDGLSSKKNMIPVSDLRHPYSPGRTTATPTSKATADTTMMPASSGGGPAMTEDSMNSMSLQSIREETSTELTIEQPQQQQQRAAPQSLFADCPPPPQLEMTESRDFSLAAARFLEGYEPSVATASSLTASEAPLTSMRRVVSGSPPTSPRGKDHRRRRSTAGLYHRDSAARIQITFTGHHPPQSPGSSSVGNSPKKQQRARRRRSTSILPIVNTYYGGAGGPVGKLFNVVRRKSVAGVPVLKQTR